MDEEIKAVIRSMNDRLQGIMETLKRVEDRQIGALEEIKETAPPTVGSFASTDK